MIRGGTASDLISHREGYMSVLNRIHNLIAAMPYGLEKMLSLMDIEESTDVKTVCVPIGGDQRLF